MRIETGLRRAFWPKRGNGGLEIWFDKFVKPDRRAYLRIGFGNFAGPDFSVSAKKVVHPLDMRRG